MPPGNQVKAKTATWSGVLLRMEKARRGWSLSRGAMMMVLKGCSGEAGVLSGLLLKKVCGWSRCWDLGCVRVLCRSLVRDWAWAKRICRGLVCGDVSGGDVQKKLRMQKSSMLSCGPALVTRKEVGCGFLWSGMGGIASLMVAQVLGWMMTLWEMLARAVSPSACGAQKVRMERLGVGRLGSVLGSAA